MIEVAHLSKGFDGPGRGPRGAAPRTMAFRDISFSVPAGEVLGVVGKSGAGKTTLLRVLSLQAPPDSGVIRIGQVRVDEATPAPLRREVLRRTATVFQGFSLLYNRTVLDNVALPLKLRGIARPERHARAREMLDFVGLGAHASAWPITLSGGEAQRVAIARALVTRPEVLFLDEPTSALDPETGQGILDLLRTARQAHPMAMILVAHQMNVVRYMCDRALHLDGGTARRLGPVKRSATFDTDPLATLWQEEGTDA
ncbi:ATP-binding cassette domain-containing protein [Oceanicola sp. S124]|uniref:ATP-binding cassette domain-containing protein n=1 Tax=Oceanicola sp. S124 TaxID=1042378 RepID=UPI0002558277|nr:ATP-binding cassette domain-containing protein [Oceanicola sp. S124]